MKTETELWIEAGKALAETPEAKIECPKCKKGYLKTLDIDSGNIEGIVPDYRQLFIHRRALLRIGG